MHTNTIQCHILQHYYYAYFIESDKEELSKNELIDQSNEGDSSEQTELEIDNAPPNKKRKVSDDCIVIGDQSDSDTACPQIKHSSCINSTSQPIFYLTRVRGISDEYNQPNYTISIKGTIPV